MRIFVTHTASEEIFGFVGVIIAIHVYANPSTCSLGTTSEPILRADTLGRAATDLETSQLQVQMETLFTSGDAGMAVTQLLMDLQTITETLWCCKAFSHLT